MVEDSEKRTIDGIPFSTLKVCRQMLPGVASKENQSNICCSKNEIRAA